MLSLCQLIIYLLFLLFLCGKSIDTEQVIRNKLRRVTKLLEIDEENVHKEININPPAELQEPLSTQVHSKLNPNPSWIVSGCILFGILIVLLFAIKNQVLSIFYQKPNSKTDNTLDITSKKENESPQISSKKDNESPGIPLKKDNESPQISSKKDNESPQKSSEKDNESPRKSSEKDNELFKQTPAPEITSNNQNQSNNTSKEFHYKSNTNQIIPHEIFSSLPKVTEIEKPETSLGFSHTDVMQLFQRTVYDIEKYEPENRKTELRIQLLHLSQIIAKTEKEQSVNLLKEDLIRTKTILFENQNQELIQRKRNAETAENKNTAIYIVTLIAVSGFLTWFYTLQTLSLPHFITAFSSWSTFLKIDIPGGNLFGLNTVLTKISEILFGIIIISIYIVVTWSVPKIGFCILLVFLSSVFSSSIFLLICCLSPVMLIMYFYMYRWLTTPLRIFVIGLISVGLGLVAGYVAAMLDPLNTHKNIFGSHLLNIFSYKDHLEEL